MLTVGSEDYQEFNFIGGKLFDIGVLMQRKLKTLPVEWAGKSLLDVGTDHGFWCFYAAEHGATYTLGLDRGRAVGGTFKDLASHNTDLANQIGAGNIHFGNINLGKQWFNHEPYDNVLMLSCYHHVYNNCMDHDSIWYWLLLHTRGTLWWEGPMSSIDPVVRKDVADFSNYDENAILNAAFKYFDGTSVSESAIPGREVWRFEPKARVAPHIPAMAVSGAGGASNAFSFENHRRALEIREILGEQPVPGSLNLRVTRTFDWNSRYFRAQILDVVHRSEGLESEWAPFWCRFYPVEVAVPLLSYNGFAMRFEKDIDRYPKDFVEVIADKHLRSYLNIPEHGGVIQLYQI